MAGAALTREERWGLAISIAGHAALLAVLLLRPATDAIVSPPERVEVTISEDFGMTSASPNPAAEAAPDEGPEIGEAAPPPPPMPEAAPAPPEPAPRVVEPPRPPAPRPVVTPEPPRPKPRPVEARKPEPPKPEPPKPVVREAPRPEPRKPVVREVAKPAPPKPAVREVARPEPPKPAPPNPAPPKAAPSPVARPAPPRTSAVDRVATSTPAKATTPPTKAGASRFAEAFGPGTPGATASTTTGALAATIGPQQISALNAAIGRQLKPHWRGKAPEGAEAELLVTRVRFRLNRDGSLAGEPQVLATTGQTEANQPQVARHQEQAVRAVKLAAPFDLPEPLYDGWKVVTTNFDRKLSQ